MTLPEQAAGHRDHADRVAHLLLERADELIATRSWPVELQVAMNIARVMCAYEEPMRAEIARSSMIRESPG